MSEYPMTGKQTGQTELVNAAAAGKNCGLAETGLVRLARRTCSAVAVVAAGVVLVCTAVSGIADGVAGQGGLRLAAFALAVVSLFGVCVAACSRTFAARRSAWIAAAAFVSFAALGFVDFSRIAPVLARPERSASLGIVLAGCLAVVLVASQAAGRLARANTCSCE